MIILNFGNMFRLTLRATGLRMLLQNWDIDLGPLSISYCWHRGHRLGISWDIMKKRDGKWWFIGKKRYWALGHTQILDETTRRWVNKTGPIWRRAYTDRYWGEVMPDGHIESISWTPKFSFDWRAIRDRIVFWFRHDVIDRIGRILVTA